MKLHLTDKDINEAIEASALNAGGRKLRNGLEVPMSSFLPADYCQGSTWKIEFKPGFLLSISEVIPRENLVFTLEQDNMQFGILICVTGKMRGTFRDRPVPLTLTGADNSVCFTSQSIRVMEYKGGVSNRSVTVKIHPRLLNRFLDDEAFDLPADLRFVANGNRDSNYSRIWPVTPAMSMTVHQILNCPYHGELKYSYLECKAMELVIHQMAQASDPVNFPRRPTSLRPYEETRVQEAKDILIRDLENPPSLRSLSRMVGLNKDKLNDGFQRLFGTSVFCYFDAYRMEHARRLLEERRMDITEIAFSTGFSQPCSFTRAFKRRFGVAPRDYQTLAVSL